MSQTRRRGAAALAAFALLTGALAACASKTPTASSTNVPTAGTTLEPAASPSPSPSEPLGPAPTCAQTKESVITGVIDPYYAFGADGAPLTSGIFSGEDGLMLEMQKPCVTGDVGGDIHNVTIAVIKYNMADATGRWWTVLICKPGKERVQCVAQFTLNDREPIEEVNINDQKLTIIYLTRPSGAGMAELSVRRTEVWKAIGTVLQKQSSSDEPYTP